MLLVFIGAAAGTYVLTKYGWNSPLVPKGEASHGESLVEQSESDKEEMKLLQSEDVSLLLSEAHAAIYDDSRIMMGVQLYMRVLEVDSNNLEALYQLGILSIQSNQLEKAAVRFKKLILLQPENQEYKDTYQSILDRLNRN